MKRKLLGLSIRAQMYQVYVIQIQVTFRGYIGPTHARYHPQATFSESRDGVLVTPAGAPDSHVGLRSS
jgi:hypothetical protein